MSDISVWFGAPGKQIGSNGNCIHVYNMSTTEHVVKIFVRAN